METTDFVFELLKNSSAHIFLTGKAGTGKTTLLHEVKKTTSKNFVVVAPTSVAAINAGGVTMHSLFQLPFGPILPDAKEDLASDQSLHKYNPEKLRLIRSLELIIIDEISMVRADLLDYLDLILRKINLTDEPFGGIQLLLIGDPLQLPPIKENWAILSRYYQSPYFFESIALKKAGFVTIELEKVHRQNDRLFIELLNAVRKGKVTQEMFEMLNKRYSGSPPTADQRYITITTHHKIVNEINLANLGALPGEIFTYKGTISGDFPIDALPADENLSLKIGARVIMIKNDDSGKKAYYNGRAAEVTQLSANGVVVSFLDDGTELNLAQQTWQNIKYNLDAQSNKIAENNAGSFSQYPIKLAWAITVHKSQGLTFDNVILDVASSFEPGQAYVALSRCRSLDGILLRNVVVPENIQTDPDAVRFMDNIHLPDNLDAFLKQNQIREQFQVIQPAFDFTAIDKRLIAVESLLVQFPVLLFKQEILDAIQKHIIRPSNKFRKDEIGKLNINLPLTENQEFNIRLVTAANYFEKQISQHSENLFTMAGDLPDMTGDGARFTDLIAEILHLLMVKLEVFKALAEKLPLTDIRKIVRLNLAKSLTRITSKEKREEPLSHPGLYEQLIQWRKDFSSKKSLPLHIIMADKTLRRIAEKTPRTLDQFATIPGIGPVKAKEIGQMILDIINAYFGTQQLF
jgi:hypothetical protein